jgi:hypothetical protein
MICQISKDTETDKEENNYIGPTMKRKREKETNEPLSVERKGLSRRKGKNWPMDST